MKLAKNLVAVKDFFSSNNQTSSQNRTSNEPEALLAVSIHITQQDHSLGSEHLMQNQGPLPETPPLRFKTTVCC